MANIIFAEQENTLQPPNLKMRQRLLSAPEKLLKTPITAKTFHTPLQSGRKAFGAVNKIPTPAVNRQDHNLLRPQEAKVKQAPQTKVEEYPEIEKFIPYDPLEFEKYSIPEDLFPLSDLALPGLACFPPSPHLCEDDLDKCVPLPSPSPVKIPKRSDCCELNAFLQTLDELSIELPPECVSE